MPTVTLTFAATTIVAALATAAAAFYAGASWQRWRQHKTAGTLIAERVYQPGERLYVTGHDMPYEVTQPVRVEMRYFPLASRGAQ